MNDWSSVLRYGIIVLLFLATYALVIRPIKSQAISTMKELPAQSRRAVSSNGLPGQAAGLQGDAAGGARRGPADSQVAEETGARQSETRAAIQQPTGEAWLREEPQVNLTQAASQITGVRKAAILMAVLGEDGASAVFRHLSEDDVQRITEELSSLGQVPVDVAQQILDEYYQLAITQEYMAQGGSRLRQQAAAEGLRRRRSSAPSGAGLAVPEDDRQ